MNNNKLKIKKMKNSMTEIIYILQYLRVYYTNKISD